MNDTKQVDYTTSLDEGYIIYPTGGGAYWSKASPPVKKCWCGKDAVVIITQSPKPDTPLCVDCLSGNARGSNRL